MDGEVRGPRDPAGAFVVVDTDADPVDPAPTSV
jgi:hypothetical protein